MRVVLLPLLLATLASAAEGPATISFATADGGTVSADLYDGGGDGVVLVHGAAFDKGSWGSFAGTLRDHGLRALAVDLRGYGKSIGGTQGEGGRFEDVLAGVRELRRRGARRVSILGASMGGRVAAEAVAAAALGEVERVVLLSPAPLPAPARLRGPSVFVASEGEAAVERIREDFRRAPEPKRLVLVPGTAHAQHVFRTDAGARLTDALLGALTGR